jgi:PAS domain S-box-containing protein
MLKILQKENKNRALQLQELPMLTSKSTWSVDKIVDMIPEAAIAEMALPFDSYESLFRTFLVDTHDIALFARADLRLLEVNKRACELHGGTARDLADMNCSLLIADTDRLFFIRGLQSLANRGAWSGEMNARRFNGETYAAAVTLKRLDLHRQTFYAIVIRDLTESDRLKQMLRQERSHRKEMYNTLRSLMKSFKKEKQGLERGIRHKIESLLLPALDKIETEPMADIRNAYVDILRSQLVELTKTFTRAIDAPFLKLTRTEMRVCQFIQNGCTGKEIAGEMNISFETVQVHRRNIRKKLGLTGRNVNLFAFLSTRPFQRPLRE